MYYGYRDNLKELVETNFKQLLNINNLSECNIELIKGLFEDTMHLEENIAFAHIDCDWYDSVYVCLDRIVPKLVMGGAIVVDDYYAWSGCKKAVDDYFQDKRQGYYFFHTSRLHIIKKGLSGDNILLELIDRANQNLFKGKEKFANDYDELKKWCDELQEGKNWLEKEYHKLKDWCDELIKTKRWLEEQLEAVDEAEFKK